VLDDELTEPDALRQAVGEEVAKLVTELSRLSRATFQGSEVSRAEHMRQMILASTRDLRVILILLADRLHFLRSAMELDAGTRQSLARESLAIHAPIAHRLGIHYLKAEIEDRAFEIMDPAAFRELKADVEQRISARRERIEQINHELADLLAHNGVAGEVLGRTKHLYSLYNKLKRDKLSLDQVFDLLATRIIVDGTDDCYKMLGLIHATYTPMPGRFKDYIALPKENGYQSLHTHVFNAHGDVIEIQIRTREMNRQAEMGVAAHFVYKESGEMDARELASINWFRQLLNNWEEGQRPEESMELLTRELTPDAVFVFTPQGEVIKLPLGATPIDFAYAVHTDVGNACAGARVDGRMVPIRTPLQNGNRVEIVTNNKQRPHKDWLKFAVSSKALARIRSYLRHQEREEAVETGAEILLREARRVGKRADELPQWPPFAEWMRRNRMHGMEEVQAAEGFGRISIREVLDKLLRDERAAETPEAPREPEHKATRAPRGGATRQVRVAGLDGLMARFAKCCSPVHGDPLLGIITRGRGVSVHQRDCPSLSQEALAPERFVDVEWAEDYRKQRPVTLMIEAPDMQSLVRLIGMLEGEEKAKITAGRVIARNRRYTQHLTLLVNDAKQLKHLLQRLNREPGVQAERTLDTA
jgi:GTP pyrophosphokinase